MNILTIFLINTKVNQRRSSQQFHNAKDNVFSVRHIHKNIEGTFHATFFVNFHLFTFLTTVVKELPNGILIFRLNQVSHMVQTFFEIFNTIQNSWPIGHENGSPHARFTFCNTGHISETPSRKVIGHLVSLSIISCLLHKSRSQKMWKMTDLTGYTVMFSRIKLHKS